MFVLRKGSHTNGAKQSKKKKTHSPPSVSGSSGKQRAATDSQTAPNRRGKKSVRDSSYVSSSAASEPEQGTSVSFNDHSSGGTNVLHQAPVCFPLSPAFFDVVLQNRTRTSTMSGAPGFLNVVSRIAQGSTVSGVSTGVQTDASGPLVSLSEHDELVVQASANARMYKNLYLGLVTVAASLPPGTKFLLHHVPVDWEVALLDMYIELEAELLRSLRVESHCRASLDQCEEAFELCGNLDSTLSAALSNARSMQRQMAAMRQRIAALEVDNNRLISENGRLYVENFRLSRDADKVATARDLALFENERLAIMYSDLVKKSMEQQLAQETRRADSYNRWFC